MGANIEILKFVETTYLPEHTHIPGYLSIKCLIKEFGVRVRERSYTFQYDKINGKVFFLVSPTNVQLPIGDATSVEEASEQAKQFLTKWLDGDLRFQRITAEEIARLEEEKRSAQK